jgi:predicted dehydrogenase
LDNELHIGIIGAGGFAAFAAKSFLQVPGVKVIAVTDVNTIAAESLAKQCDATVYIELGSFLLDDKIDLVYIGTPPFLHYEHSKKALLAGKHVICEKPAALKTLEAEELQSLAQSMQLLYVVNLMQRYNPLYNIVNLVITEKILGNFLHGFFENYASDENLDKDHWFWDPVKSGGIFIEHGVHFFDMFSGWLGEGKVINAITLQRRCDKKNITDRVQATLLYKEGIVNFYHGFDQPIILDRQEMRLEFEHGEITLYEWVPVKIKLHGLVTKDQINRLHELMKDLSLSKHTDKMNNKKVKGRFSEIAFDEHITIEYGNADLKQSRYGELLVDMLTDQWAWIRDRDHKRVIDSNNAVESLRIAEMATSVAQQY